MGSSPRARGAQQCAHFISEVMRIIPACAGSTTTSSTGQGAPGDHPRVRGEHCTCTGGTVGAEGSSPRARGALGHGPGHRLHRGIIPACAGSTGVDRQRIGQSRDHPRVRGEHWGCSYALTLRAGSSPRARGALPTLRGRKESRGIIPACAGSTTRPRSGTSRRRDHPRVRGEHWRPARAGEPSRGSSPRARGAPQANAPAADKRGIIPACAGSTRHRGAGAPVPRDHPRVRGEHYSGWSGPRARSGSSPRARGARTYRDKEYQHEGIIPACAGSTMLPEVIALTPRDHPRVRGEHIPQLLTGLLPAGSSPRARGAPLLGDPRWLAPGIIPACAGSTPRRAGRSVSWRDHPRVRGEHTLALGGKRSTGGSSPRARGALDEDGVLRRQRGIIPACAGSTRTCTARVTRRRDHPRVRGEHYSSESMHTPQLGSSPRARGARAAGDHVRTVQGIIPACAGSTVPPMT